MSKECKLQFACWDNDADGLVAGLSGLFISEVNWLIVNQPINYLLSFLMFMSWIYFALHKMSLG